MSWLAGSSRSLREQVRDRGLLGRDPEQADRLDQELARRTARPELVDQRDGGEEREAQQVADDHRLAPVEPVGEHAGQRAEHERGQQPEEQHARRGRSCLPAKLSTSEVAVAVIASRPSQSPKLDSDIDSHSLRKSRMRSTARTLATRLTPLCGSWSPSGCPSSTAASAPDRRSSSVSATCSPASGTPAPSGLGVPAGGRPSAGTAVGGDAAGAGSVTPPDPDPGTAATRRRTDRSQPGGPSGRS